MKDTLGLQLPWLNNLGRLAGQVPLEECDGNGRLALFALVEALPNLGDMDADYTEWTNVPWDRLQWWLPRSYSAALVGMTSEGYLELANNQFRLNIGEMQLKVAMREAR